MGDESLAFVLLPKSWEEYSKKIKEEGGGISFWN